MTKNRALRVLYLKCALCDHFILYERESLAATWKNGRCPVCRSNNTITKLLRVGYVSAPEGKNGWTSTEPSNHCSPALDTVAV